MYVAFLKYILHKKKQNTIPKLKNFNKKLKGFLRKYWTGEKESCMMKLNAHKHYPFEASYKSKSSH